MENWGAFADWAAKGILGGICLYGVRILSQMKNSIEALNEKVATIIERTDWHTKEIDRLDQRITRIEEKL
jgi:hypothetical protein